ncbi:hypothetical protein D3C73_1396860 [compost metagenome]
MNVPNFKARAFTSQTAGSECRQTTLMRKFCQRVRLVHKLRQLRTAEELFNGRDNRTNIDQGLRSNCIRILNRHSLTHYALHTGQTDTELVLQQFTYGTQTAVPQVVNIIRVADTVQQINKVAD